VRTDHNPHRIELQGVPGRTNIQLHVGNAAADVTGCFAVGNSRQANQVNGSTAAMTSLNNVVNNDGTGNISVVVNGASTPPQQPAQQPAQAAQQSAPPAQQPTQQHQP
jgi:hypothetical protein